jgi:hypothetical protein
VVNPAAKTTPGAPIYGMPILNVATNLSNLTLAGKSYLGLSPQQIRVLFYEGASSFGSMIDLRTVGNRERRARALRFRDSRRPLPPGSARLRAARRSANRGARDGGAGALSSGLVHGPARGRAASEVGETSRRHAGGLPHVIVGP